MSRSARLLDLIQALRRHRRPVTAAQLAAELGVSVRTVYRDIVTLSAAGAPIVGEAGLGYVLQRGFFLPPLMFTSDEVDALMLGLQFVAARGDPELIRAAEDATAKIAAVLPPPLRDEAAASGLIAAGGDQQAGWLATIRRALRSEQRLQLAYQDKRGRTTDRIVWPVALGFFQDSEMLAAWCELRQDFRHFRLDRIAEAATCGRMPQRRQILLARWKASEGLDPADGI
jgi:predicted DNA-binding transcriptional regulator YafY